MAILIGYINYCYYYRIIYSKRRWEQKVSRGYNSGLLRDAALLMELQSWKEENMKRACRIVTKRVIVEYSESNGLLGNYDRADSS